MTPLDAMKQALSALELMNRTLVAPYGQTLVLEPQITNLRAAIEQMEKVEPVAWMQSNHLNQLAKRHAGSSMMLARCSDHKAMSDFEPLFTAPVAPVQQEPVAWNGGKGGREWTTDKAVAESWLKTDTQQAVPLYLHPVAPEYYQRLATEYEKGLSICEADYRKQAAWIEKAKAYLEAQCGDLCNAEYNPCEARELLKELS